MGRNIVFQRLVARVGFEAKTAENASKILDASAKGTTTGADDATETLGDSSPFGPTVGPVEAALARALDAAAAAGRFDVVALLATELGARRLAAAGNVVALDVKRRERR